MMRPILFRRTGTQPTMISPEAVLNHISVRLPDFNPVSDPVPLSGGLLNYVWRVPGRTRSLVVKYAPPYIATLPEIALDPERIVFEARSLETFSPGGPLVRLAYEAARPPALIDFDAEQAILIQEDAGNRPDLGQWLRAETSGPDQGVYLGKLIGQFVGALHRQTYLDESFRRNFNNIAIQESRLQGQYARIAAYLKRGGVSDAVELGLRALELGQQLLRPGLCLIMGDLWPPSLLVTDAGLRVIDWEFAHFGRPAQDVGHLAAHLWMHHHRAPSVQGALTSQVTLDRFLQSYRNQLGDAFEDMFGADGICDSAIHFGAEVLARTVGTYQPGYLYDGLSPESTPIREAVEVAAAHIRLPEATATFAVLAR